MKWKLINTVTISIFLAASLIGCNNSDPSSDNKDGEVEIVGEEVMAVGFVELIGRSLLTGAATKAGSEGMGFILDLLLNGEGDDDQAELDEMNGKLDQLVAGLENISNEVNIVNQELKISTDEIIQNANDPYEAMDTIDDAQTNKYDDTVKAYSIDGEVGTLNPLMGCALSNSILYDSEYNTLKAMTDIQHAMLPINPSSHKSVLTNYMKLNHDSNAGIYEGYLNFERYVSMLLYYQVKGLNLNVEALNIPHSLYMAGVECNVTEAPLAIQHAEDFEESKKSAIWNPTIADSFIYNVWSHALYYLSKDNIESINNISQNKLDSEIADSVKRGEFYRRIAVGDHNKTGVNFMHMSPADENEKKVYFIQKYGGPTINAIADDNYTTEYNVTSDIYYTSWTVDSDGNERLSKRNDYTFRLYRFDMNETGTYELKEANTLVSLPDIAVQAYSEEYLTGDLNSTIPYGLRFVTTSSNFTYNVPKLEINKIENTRTTLTKEDGYIKLVGKSVPSFDGSTTTYKGKYEYRSRFYYDGVDRNDTSDVEDEVQLHYNVYVYRKLELQPNAQYAASASAELRIGLNDETAGKIQYCEKDVYSYSKDGLAGSKSSKDTFKSSSEKPCKVTLMKDHKYSFFIEGYVHGDGGGGAGIAYSDMHVHAPEVMRLSFE